MITYNVPSKIIKEYLSSIYSINIVVIIPDATIIKQGTNIILYGATSLFTPCDFLACRINDTIYDTIVVYAAATAPNFGMNIKFKIILSTAAIIVLIAIVVVFL